jgi:hypothetical protein
VASGWAAGLAHPGRNLTGIFLDLPELGGKQIELLKEAVPTLTHLAVLWDSTIGVVQFRATEAAGGGGHAAIICCGAGVRYCRRTGLLRCNKVDSTKSY